MMRLSRVPWFIRYRYGAELASRFRRIAIQLTHRHCRVYFRGRAHLGRGFSLFIPDHGTLIIGDGVQFRRDFYCEILGNGEVVIGDGCVFTEQTSVKCSTRIEIGDGCLFGHVLIADGNHRFRDPSVPFLGQGYDFRRIRIGRGAVVLSMCTILNDVGERAVIGAGSVVTRPIPPYSLAVGAPARVRESFGAPSTAS
jgi:acetyltransferase-like isoleucine patch superfamily enzyme